MSLSHPPTEPGPVARWRWKRLLAAFLAMALVVTAYAIWWPNSRQRDDALRDCRNNRFADAETALNELITQRPDDMEVRKCLARGYAAAERPADAEPHLSKLIETQPQNADFRRLRMEQYRKLKRTDAAYADARKLLELEPGDSKLRRSAMTQAFNIGHFAEAEELCRASLAEQPDDRGLRSVLAEIRRARGDDDGAGQILDELIRQDRNDYAALFARGLLYDETGRSDLAVPLLWQVFNDDTSRKRTAGYQLSLALGKIGREEEARQVLAEVRRLQHVEVFTDAIKSQPDNLELQVRLARMLLQDGHTADGVGLLEHVLRRAPTFAPAHLALAEHYDKQGQADRAARHRQQASGKP